MKQVLVVLWIVGCVALTVRRIPDFSSDRALWLSAWPSDRPRVAVNIAAALIRTGEHETGAIWALRALDLTERDASDYEREAVTAIVRRQLNYINLFIRICDRPAYSSHC